MSYEATKGRSRNLEENSRILYAAPQAAVELGERGRERAVEMRGMHKQYLPDWEPFFRGLYELGLVPGWRAIVRLDLKEKR